MDSKSSEEFRAVVEKLVRCYRTIHPSTDIFVSETKLSLVNPHPPKIKFSKQKGNKVYGIDKHAMLGMATFISSGRRPCLSTTTFKEKLLLEFFPQCCKLTFLWDISRFKQNIARFLTGLLLCSAEMKCKGQKYFLLAYWPFFHLGTERGGSWKAPSVSS